MSIEEIIEALEEIKADAKIKESVHETIVRELIKINEELKAKIGVLERQ